MASVVGWDSHGMLSKRLSPAAGADSYSSGFVLQKSASRLSMLSITRLSAKAPWPRRSSFASPILKSRRSSKLSQPRNASSRQMSTMRLSTVPTHPGGVCTRQHRIQLLITAPFKSQHQIAPCNGALNHKPRFRRRKYMQSTSKRRFVTNDCKVCWLSAVGPEQQPSSERSTCRRYAQAQCRRRPSSSTPCYPRQD